MLKELNLTYVIKEGVVMITTQEEAESTLETRVYPVGDLVLPPNAPADAQADFDSLIEFDYFDGQTHVVGRGRRAGQHCPLPEQSDAHDQPDGRSSRGDRRLVGSAAAGRPRIADIRRPPGGKAGGRPTTARAGRRRRDVRRRHGHGRHGRRAASKSRPNTAPAKSKSQPADLLQGVQETNKGLQGRQSEKLNKMYKDSGKKKGVGAGMF